MTLTIQYRDPSHEEVPHVVRMSGGRSSAFMALRLAETSLSAARRDVVLFANTSAEHPGTYDFAAKVCDILELEYGIPCFWYEYCAVEEVVASGTYTRIPTYRLVLRRPAARTDNPDRPGYSSDGSVFEAMVSWNRLPSVLRRVCTSEMKTQPGHELISEWLQNRDGPRHRGHHGEQSLVTADVVADRYSGESLSRDEKHEMVEFATTQPFKRPAQRWVDFTSAQLATLEPRPYASADLWGRWGPPDKFVSVLGLRADEPLRVRRALERSLMAEGAATAACRDPQQPGGELVYTPLHDNGVGKDDVHDFWRRQEFGFDLDIPAEAGNCVYCFMKGQGNLQRLVAQEDAAPRKKARRRTSANGSPTPDSVRWWIALEERYGRPSTKCPGEKLGMLPRFNRGQITSYAELTAAASRELAAVCESPQLEQAQPCACTD